MAETSASFATDEQSSLTIPCPHPAWRPEDVISRATELVPVLRARMPKCEAEGRMLEETNDELLEAGFYRILQPRRFGGYEFGMPTFAKTMMEVSRGCPSSGWVLALTAGHIFALSAFFAEQAQIEVYGAEGDFRAPSSMSPRPGAVGVPVDGGYLVSGEWDYASGIDVSTHYFAGIMVPSGPDGSETDPRIALLDRSAYSIVNNWNVMGMRGTGSRRAIVKDVFVPEYRVLVPPRDLLRARSAPGRNVHANPFFRAGRLTSLTVTVMAAVAVGIAEGMLDVYGDEISGKPQREAGRGTVLGTRRADSPAYQRHYGEAWAMIHAAESTVLKAASDYERFAREDVEDGVAFSDERDHEIQIVQQYAIKCAADAVDLLFRTGGTSSALEGSVLQQYFRDMSVLVTHNTVQFDRGIETFGKVHFTNEVVYTNGAF